MVRYLMELSKEKSNRTERLLLKKLLLSETVCTHLKTIPFELVLQYLELEVRPKNQLIIRAGDFYDRVFMLIEGTL